MHTLVTLEMEGAFCSGICSSKFRDIGILLNVNMHAEAITYTQQNIIIDKIQHYVFI